MGEAGHLRLSELCGLVRDVLDAAFPEACWVVAEVASLRVAGRGHCYLELAEKEQDEVKAQISAVIWANEYRVLSAKFQSQTGTPIAGGQQLLLLTEVDFHPRYGLKLRVVDIDPTYTLGEMARRRREVIERLQKEGLYDLNRSLELPLAPQRIAVISSGRAAGYQDFLHELASNRFGYAFRTELFEAIVQGEEAEKSLVAALTAVQRARLRFDVIVVIRGGGSTVDLSCFDGYAQAAAIAGSALPVITGIGHERDESVADLVAYRSVKTPTAAAQFLIARVSTFEERMWDLAERARRRAQQRLRGAQDRLDVTAGRFLRAGTIGLARRRVALDAVSRRFDAGARGAIRSQERLVETLAGSVRHMPALISAGARAAFLEACRKLRSAVAIGVERHDGRLRVYAERSRLLDPVETLRRGYSVTYDAGRVVRDASSLGAGATIETRFYAGEALSRVTAVRNGHGEGTDLQAGLRGTGDDRRRDGERRHRRRQAGGVGQESLFSDKEVP